MFYLPLILERADAGMLFPPDFNLIDLEACRRHHVVLATLASTGSVMELHLNLAEFYQERITALESLGPQAHCPTRLCSASLGLLPVIMLPALP